jgi:hypothetical protein
MLCQLGSIEVEHQDSLADCNVSGPSQDLKVTFAYTCAPFRWIFFGVATMLLRSNMPAELQKTLPQ